MIKTNINIYSPFKNNFIKLRTLYNNYIKEINLLNNNKLLLLNIKDIIVSTEVLLNMLYLYGWNINRMKNLDKIKNSDTKKINSITLDIIKEFTKIIVKSIKLFY